MDLKIQTFVNYGEAEKVLLEKLQKIKAGAIDYKNVINEVPIDQPVELKNPLWKIDEPSLKNTLRYLFQISHQCYILCIQDNTPYMYKIIPPLQKIYHKALEEAFKKLKDNPHLTDEQRRRIVKVKPVRVMQCVIKEHVNKEVETNEYQDVLSRLNLPDGLYVLNLTDAVILRKDWKHPFPMVVGKVPMTHYKSFLPILSISGQKGYADIPIPNYDEIEWVYKKDNIYENFITDWSKKTIDKAVFRGGPTGCGYTAETNMRIKLALLSKEPAIMNDLDVGLSGKGKTIDSLSLRFDPTFGLGMLNTGITPTDKFLKMYEQSQYKYIIHIDGNVNAYRMLYTMTTGSLILRVMSEYTSWAEQFIKPNVHYIPVNSDLSNLQDVLDWCKTNQQKCQEIAGNALKLSRTILTADFLDNYFKMILGNFTATVPISEKVSKKISDDSLYIPSMIIEDIRVNFEDCGNNMETYFLEYAKDRIEGRCRNEGFIRPGSAKVVSYTSGIIHSTEAQFRVLFLFDVCFPYEGMVVECIVKSVSKIGIRATIGEPTPMVVYVLREHNAFLDYKINSKIYVKICGHRFEHNDPFISVFGELV
jgi:DNA-directed RNA polymerase subunit E'/Rpb7